MKRIAARETARLLNLPVKQTSAKSYARNVTAHAKVVTRLQAKAVRLRRELRTTLGKLSEAKRMLRLAAESFGVGLDDLDVPDVGKLDAED